MREIDKLIHAKLTLKGSQLVYQLDVTSRELRMLKDNFFLMEGLMHKEMRHEFEKAISERDNKIKT